MLSRIPNILHSTSLPSLLLDTCTDMIRIFATVALTLCLSMSSHHLKMSLKLNSHSSLRKASETCSKATNESTTNRLRNACQADLVREAYHPLQQVSRNCWVDSGGYHEKVFRGKCFYKYLNTHVTQRVLKVFKLFACKYECTCVNLLTKDFGRPFLPPPC